MTVNWRWRSPPAGGAIRTQENFWLSS